MKRVIFRLSILFFSIVIGFSVVWLWNLSVFLNWEKEIKSNPVGILRTASYDIAEFVFPLSKPRFRQTYRACGLGYRQSYETNDKRELSEGITEVTTPQQVRAKIDDLINNAVGVVERVPGYKNYRGESGERIVLIMPRDEWNDNEKVSILWLNDEAEFIAFIEAPDLDLALEFEKFLESTDYGY